MAFDVNNPSDVLTLKTELTTDPISMGYELDKATSKIVRLLNDPVNNVGGETKARVFDVEAMLDALDPTELDAQQTNTEAAKYTHILIEFAAFGDIAQYKVKWGSMFAGNSSTVTALNAQTSVKSRAEVLFGNDSRITENDINVALSS